MKIYKNPSLDQKYRNGVIAIGNFDGLHLGHQKVINEGKQKAKKNKLPFGVMTFEPVPVMFFNKKIKNHRINSLEQKKIYLKKFKLDFLIIIKFNKLGLVGSIQHLHLLPTYKDHFEQAGFDVTIPVGGARLSFPGQVLGCNYSGDDPTVGHYIFLGSGDFHPIGLVLHTGKPLAMLDPYTGEAKEMGKERIERILRQRSGLIMSSMDKNRFGILIGAKPGQMRRNLALRMKKKLEKHGKKGFLLAIEHVGPELIDFYPVDVFVNTACPRIAIDDAVKYAKPMITPYELEVALGEKKWENGYRFDQIH